MENINLCNGSTIWQVFDCHFTPNAVLLDLQIAQSLPNSVCIALTELQYLIFVFDCGDTTLKRLGGKWTNKW